jgi:hypothetical protein
MNEITQIPVAKELCVIPDSWRRRFMAPYWSVRHYLETFAIDFSATCFGPKGAHSSELVAAVSRSHSTNGWPDAISGCRQIPGR